MTYSVRPTCLFLAAKTTNYPVPLDVFTPKFKGLSQQDILDTEFVLAQSLGFEFWIRGAEKAFRGWGLEFQVGHVPNIVTTPAREVLGDPDHPHCHVFGAWCRGGSTR